MKRNIKTLYLCLLLVTIFISIFAIFINNISLNIKNISIISILAIIIIILISTFGFKKDNGYLKVTTTKTVIAMLMAYMLVIYMLGIIVGFNKGLLIINFKSFLINLLPIILIITGIEIIRYLIFINCYKNKSVIIIFTTLTSILLVLYELNISSLITSEDKFIFLSTIIFPIISQELLCSYMTYKIGLLPSLVFKLVINLYIYIIPIIPNLGDYLYSVVNIILPFLIYVILNRSVIKYNKEKEQLKKANHYIFTVSLLIILGIVIILVSGVFKYKLIAIASNSMKPIYSRGDAIIYEKVDPNDLEVGDILVFQNKEGLIITHRITKIWKQGDGYYYTTKGDNNNTEDAFNPTKKDIIGRVKYKIKYLGYPTVLISEYFGREKE